MRAPLIVVSGLPGSGKSTLARRLAPALGLTVIDKDDILEELFTAKGVGDAAWRRALSRESDLVLRARAISSGAAIVTSFWRLAGMPEDSGTPTDWFRETSHPLVHLRCVCAPELAATRFVRRRRHPGHLDGDRTYEQVLASLRDLTALGALDVEPWIDVDTSEEPVLDEVVRAIHRTLAHD